MAEEKTAGTPNAGRMAPGAEGKGRIRRQRYAEIKGEMGKDMQKLYKQAQSVADFMGHGEIELWRVEEGADCAQVKCKICGIAGGFALNPMWETIWVNEKTGPRVKERRQRDKINGPLFERRCGE
jgi:hypothetical protein